MKTYRTRIFRIDENNLEEAIAEAAAIIKEGGTVAFPTETVYGLGADALNPEAVKAIFQAKGRPADNPLIVHVSSKEQCESLVKNISDKAVLLMNIFWPGPLTLIMERKQVVPDITTGGLDTVALRMPDNKVAMELIKCSGKAIAAPSANRSGKPSPTTAEHVISDLDGRIDVVIDGGPVIVGVESTVIDMTTEPPAILRPGMVSQQDIENEIGSVDIGYDDKVHPDNKEVRSPGMKYTHYSPDANVILVEGNNENVTKKISQMFSDFQMRGAKIGLLLTEESAKHFVSKEIFSLGRKDKPEETASSLFFGLRYMDEKKVDVILVDGSFSHLGVGAAVSNRIRKAAEMIIKV
ncbi:L-threonylcarbamoyladenylate synthase [Methanolobus sp. ZRKC3]|uniref:L-threonylcarbamoyladenylate synthase n=1 Tax=Methanolobus sp. ZRKC3 TaxID=3125786 RepID=UPI00325153BF